MESALFEKYERTVEGFAEYLGKDVREPFLVAPGVSASQLARDLESVSSARDLRLPPIHQLTREESFALYHAADVPIEEILGPLLGKYETRRVPFLEDFTFSGSKISLISETLKTFHGIPSVFYVMVANEGIELSRNTHAFVRDHDLAVWLKDRAKE